MVEGRIVKVSGPLVVAEGMREANMFDVVRVGECRTSGRRIEVPFDAKGRGIVRAELMFMKDGADVKWDKRYWETKDIAEFDPASGRVVTELPEGAFAWIVNFTTDDGLVFSTKYSEAEQP